MVKSFYIICRFVFCEDEFKILFGSRTDFDNAGCGDGRTEQ